MVSISSFSIGRNGFFAGRNSVFGGRNSFSAAQSLVRLSTLAATPNFELRFNIAQNAALDRLNKKITAINRTDFGRGKTALIKIKIAQLERRKEAVAPFKATTQSNKSSVEAALEKLGELRALADPSNAAAFDAKLQEVLKTFETFRTAKRFTFGVSDRLRDARNDGKAILETISHNDFATQDDIDAALGAINQVSGSLDQSLAYLDINLTIAKKLYKSADIGLDKAKLKVDEIEAAERQRQIKEIKQLEAQTARILTSVSLSFEVAQSFAAAINKNAILPREIEPGSVLNLFV